MICDGPCPPPPPPIQCPQVSGDVGQALEVVPVRIVAGGVTPIADADVLELTRPLQGGQVIYTGVRARNVDGCQVQLTGALRDPDSGRVVALEQRPTYLAVEGDGWAGPVVPLTQTLANVAACPSAAATRDLDGNPWTLELRLDAADGRSATVTRTVWLRCDGFDPLGCACECDSDYVLGGACPVDPVDAGVD